MSLGTIKYLGAILVLVVAFASCSEKPIEQAQFEYFPEDIVSEEEPIDHLWTYGTINTKSAEQGCPVLIDCSREGVFRPNVIEDRFIVDELNVRFKYKVARATSESSCSQGQPILIEAIQIIK